MTRSPESEPPALRSPAWDERTRRTAAIALVLAVLALGTFLLFGLLDSIIIAALLAFLIEPVVRLGVEKLGLRRWLSLLIVYLIVAAVAFGAVLFLPVMVIGSIAQIDVAEIVRSIDQWLSDLAATVASSDILGIDMSGMDAVSETVAESTETTTMLEPERLLDAFGGFLTAAAGFLGVVVGAVSAVFFVLIIAVYLSADSDRYFRAIGGLAPHDYEDDVFELGRRLNRAWSDYVRGQGVMVLVIGFTTFVVTWLLGVPGALFLGVIAGLLEVIPTFGPIISTIPAVLIALFQGSTRFEMNNLVFALLVVAAYILIQQLESNLIAPKVMGTQVQLPALVVLISIAAAYQVAGILGAILAVPMVASAKVIMSYVWAKVRSLDPWVAPS